MRFRTIPEWLYDGSEPTAGSPAPTVTTPTQGHPDLSKPPAAPGEVRPAQVYMTVDEWAAYQKELADLRTFRQSAAEAADAERNARLKAEFEKGKVEESLKALDDDYKAKIRAEADRAEQIRTRWLEEKRNAALSEALSGVRFAGQDPTATAKMVRKLLSEEVEATLDSQGNPVVIDRTTRRPAIDYIRERMQSPEFAVFLEAATRGGAGADGARPAATMPQSTSPDQQRAAWAEQFRAQQAARKSGNF